MEFKTTNLDNVNENDLIMVLNHNARCASFTRGEIEKLKKATASSESKISIVSKPEKVIVEKMEEEDKVFEDKVQKCLDDIKSLEEDVEENIYEMLPSERDYDYEKIILRVILEFKKEINDINEIVVDEYETMSKEDLEEFSKEIKGFQKCIELLKNVLKEEKSEDADDDIDNTIIFIPTTSGNPRLLDDIKSIPEDSYEEFLELFLSIKDGSFKGDKRFQMNHKLIGLREVKGSQLRITYVKLGKNTYGILNAFMKKVDSSHGYRNMLYTRYKDYKNNVRDKIKKKIKDEEFLKVHKDYEIEVFRMLGIENEEQLQKIKKGNE